MTQICELHCSMMISFPQWQCVFFRVGEDFVDVGKTIKVKYSAGEWSGRLVKDKVGFGGFNMGISHFSLISSSSDFFIEGAEWAGILGMAYQSLAKVIDTCTMWL